MTARLTIALVTWNGLEHVRTLLTAIKTYTRLPYKLLVVDNASTDGTRELLRSWGDGLTLVENDKNRHCAAATNQAIELCDTEFLVYLCARHALVTDPGWEQSLVRYLDEHPEVGIAGHAWGPGFALPSRLYAAGWSCEKHGVDRLLHVQGGAWIARRSLFDEVGRFNAEEHPHGGMDVELSYRLQSLGRPLGDVGTILCPSAPELPRRTPRASVYHPATPEVVNEVRTALGMPQLDPSDRSPPKAFVSWYRRRCDAPLLPEAAMPHLPEVVPPGPARWSAPVRLLLAGVPARAPARQ